MEPATTTKKIKFSYQAEWYQKNLEYNRKIRRDYSRKYRKEHPKKRLLQGAKNRATSKGIEFNLSLEDITIPEFCPILKQRLIPNTPYAPSLDRINPQKGYVKGNVWVISRKANVMKNNASLEELKEFADWVKTFQLS